MIFPESSTYFGQTADTLTSLRLPPLAEFELRKSKSSMTGIIPAQALYGEYDFIFFGDNGQALDALGLWTPSVFTVIGSFYCTRAEGDGTPKRGTLGAMF